jgi:HSP20 family protein
MPMCTDPLRELDRFAQQVLDTAGRPAVMPMDAWREGEEFVVEFDLPGINADSADIDIERKCGDRVRRAAGCGPQPRDAGHRATAGVFSRRLVLGEKLDTERIEASYHEGVLSLHIPVAEKAKPRKISVGRGDGHKAISDNAAKREVMDA